MTTLVMWLNGHVEKDYAWLEPVEKNTLLASNPFLNLASRAETKEICALLREAFGKTSYTVEIAVDEIKPTVKGPLAVEMTLEELLERMVPVAKAPVVPVSDKASAKLAQMRAELAQIQVTTPVRKAVLSADQDPFA